MMAEPAYANATLHTRLTLAADAVLDNISSIYLASFGDHLGGIPQRIALVWNEEPNGSFWFSWRLQVIAGDKHVTLKSTTGPVVGHTYEVWLSYDQASGDIAIVLTDITADSVIYRGGMQLSISIDTAYPGAGYEMKTTQVAASEVLTHVDMELIPQYMPLAFEWQIAARSSEGELVHTTRLNTSDQLVIEFNAHAKGFTGYFEFSLTQGDSVTELGTFSSTNVRSKMIIPASILPLGSSTLTIRYVEDGKVLLSDDRSISVGMAHIHARSLSFDPQNGSLIGSILITSQGSMTVELLLQATIQEMI